MDLSALQSGFATLPAVLKTKIIQAALKKEIPPSPSKTTPAKRKAEALDPEVLTCRLSALLPKGPCLEDFPFSTNALTHAVMSRHLKDRIDIHSLSLDQRKSLATGPTVTVVVGMKRVQVFANMPANALALISRVAQQQIYGGARYPARVWFTDCNENAVVSLCYFVRDLFTQENDKMPSLPRDMDISLLEMMKVYQAGCAMDTGPYLFPLQQILVDLISSFEQPQGNSALDRKRIQHTTVLSLTEKLETDDPVFQCIVRVTAEMRRKAVFRDRAFGKTLEVSFPKVIRAMDWLDEAEEWKREEVMVDIRDWWSGVQDALLAES